MGLVQDVRCIGDALCSRDFVSNFITLGLPFHVLLFFLLKKECVNVSTVNSFPSRVKCGQCRFCLVCLPGSRGRYLILPKKRVIHFKHCCCWDILQLNRSHGPQLDWLQELGNWNLEIGPDSISKPQSNDQSWFRCEI
jgi:hypothetical protein